MQDIQEKFTKKQDAINRAKELSKEHEEVNVILSNDSAYTQMEPDPMYYVETGSVFIRVWEQHIVQYLNGKLTINTKRK